MDDHPATSESDERKLTDYPHIVWVTDGFDEHVDGLLCDDIVLAEGWALVLADGWLDKRYADDGRHTHNDRGYYDRPTWITVPTARIRYIESAAGPPRRHDEPTDGQARSGR